MFLLSVKRDGITTAIILNVIAGTICLDDYIQKESLWYVAYILKIHQHLLSHKYLRENITRGTMFSINPLYEWHIYSEVRLKVQASIAYVINQYCKSEMKTSE